MSFRSGRWGGLSSTPSAPASTPSPSPSPSSSPTPSLSPSPALTTTPSSSDASSTVVSPDSSSSSNLKTSPSSQDAVSTDIPTSRVSTLVHIAVPIAASAAIYVAYLNRDRIVRSLPLNGLSLTSPAQLEAFTGESSASACLRYFARPLITTVKITQSPTLSSPSSSSLSRLHLLTALSHVDLSANEIPRCPPLLPQLNALQRLNLSRNKLTSLPPELGSLHSLQELDVSRNQLQQLPSEICQLARLRVLNAMANQLTSLPEEIGKLKQVHRLGLKSNRLTSLPESLGDMVGLVELFITDNQLTSLPASMGNLKKLFKLQASFNRLSSLPSSMGDLPALELMRVAVNNLTHVPTTFCHLDRLAWFSLAGNPACPEAPKRALEFVGVEELDLGPLLGDGASGDSFACRWRGADCVFKRFKAETSPDGHCSDEIAVACAVDHPHLVKVVAMVKEPHGVVMPRVHAVSMADKPSFDSLLRCRWPPHARFSLPSILAIAHGIASALAYLHSQGICHGDVYAHNILAGSDGSVVLCDFGASFFYSQGSLPYEAFEVRAFGLFLNDLFHRLQDPESTLEFKWRETLAGIIENCMHSTALQRLAFADVVSQVAMLQRSVNA